MKYKVLAQFLREDIMLHANNLSYKLPSERELTAKFGVSRQTVRRAMSDLESEGLITSRRGSGYYATNAGTSSHAQIAVITTFTDEYIFPNILRDMENVLGSRGYQLMSYATLNRVSAEREILNRLISHPVGGILVEGSKTALPNPNMDLYQTLHKMGIPIVFFQGNYPALSYLPSVTDDNYAGGYRLATYLLDKGRRNIGGIFKSDDLQGPERYSGMMNAIRDRGLSLPDHSICWFDSVQRTRLVDGKDMSLIASFMKEHLPLADAVICYNDEIAYHLIKYLTENGKNVPQDIAVASFDNSYYSRISTVPITSLWHRTRRMGTEAATLMLSILQGKNPHSLVLPWELSERQST